MKSSLTKSRNYYKPFSYPWAYDAFMASEQMHWLWTEVPMIEDIKDWKNVLTDGERDFLTKVFRFFTQGDIDVSSAYVNTYLPFFPTPEIRMMLSSFAAREAVHIAAYSHLIETIGMPETVYNEFLQYEAMAEKHDFFHGLAEDQQENIAVKMAAFSAFTEGMQLFSSFVMLLNFTRNGTMKGMVPFLVKLRSITKLENSCIPSVKAEKAAIFTAMFSCWSSARPWKKSCFSAMASYCRNSL